MSLSPTNKDAVVLKPERDKHVRNRHPWVFMGAIQSYPESENGGILPVVTVRGDFVGYGYFNKGQSISGRMFSFFEEGDPEQIFIRNIKNALAQRKLIARVDTTAYRLINGEGDDLPGLIVDRYGEVLVMQANTLGIEKLKPLIIQTLKEELGDMPIFEKSDSPTRRKEGLENYEGWALGGAIEPVIVTEHGLQFSVGFTGMQKTGFFLDQREMRQLVKGYSKDMAVLNTFSYTGGFSVYALAGGAKFVDSVDISAKAMEGARENVLLNGFSETNNNFYVQDSLEFLNERTEKGKYNFIILDPPAFAKRASDIENATRGYRDLNRAAMEKLPFGGLLLTSSCSAHIDKELFQTIIFQAAKDTKRKVRILSYHVLAADHPLNLFYPEGDYLKSLLLYIE